MATSQTCCHLPGEMLNSAAECADRARISIARPYSKSLHTFQGRNIGKYTKMPRIAPLWLAKVTCIERFGLMVKEKEIQHIKFFTQRLHSKICKQHGDLNQ
jgi:hypothetical protein